MSIKSVFAIPFAKQVRKRVYKWALQPHKTQEKVFKKLISQAKDTAFGKDHSFDKIKSYKDFKDNVPINDYEGLRTYVDRMVAGEEDVLWRGKPIYYAKTSGTTSGAKYIPITKDSMPTHIKAARNALLLYIAETNDASFVNGKM
ncbi:MAG: GH3 auxin-responsive promoter family protein, partial [Flavobacteriaceae bacterium]|nr:GH3 auxin-responsive promoter family protein [Flavobacteriaceae bacterium]